MPAALVHIGLHKAGSTYLQNICQHNRKVLRGCGIRFLNAVTREDIRVLRRRIHSGEVSSEEALWNPVALRAELGRGPARSHMFLSCESLETLGRCPRSMADLDALLRERYSTVEYLVVVRHPIDQASSEMQQSIKSMQRSSLGVLERRIESKPLGWRLQSFMDADYPLTVLDFDTLVKGDTPAQLGSLFATHFAIEAPALADVPPANESIGALGVAFMLALNYLARRATVDSLPRVADWTHLKAIQVHTRQAIRDRLHAQKRFMPFTDAQQRESLQRFREENRAFIERFPGPWVERVFAAGERPHQLVLLSELPAERRARIAALLLETWARIEPLLAKDMKLRPAFKAPAVLERYLQREREIMLGGGNRGEAAAE